ncbi:MAG: phosphotransferase [Alphaproteobacteria bacterium]
MAEAMTQPRPAAPDDRRLPVGDVPRGLAFAVDGGAMATRLERALVEAAFPARVLECVVERVKYAPGQRCSIGYRVVAATAHGERHALRLSARLFETGAARGRYERYRQDFVARPIFGPPLMLLEDREMVLWSFPNDRHLPALPLLANLPWLAGTAAPEMLQRALGGGYRITACEPIIASYVHERRCCVRLLLHLDHIASGAKRQLIVFGKTSGAGSTARTEAAATAFWEAEARRLGRFVTPRPLGTFPDPRIAWQEAAPGQSLDPFAAAETTLRQVAASVAALHGATIPGLEASTQADDLARLDERAACLVQGWPWLAARLHAIRERLHRTAPAAPRIGCVHGDLHAGNILVDEDRVSIIDVDEATVGPVARDLGRFAAYVLWDGLLRSADEATTSRAFAAFLEGYATAAPLRLAEVAWHASLRLVTEKIFRAVTLMQPLDGQVEHALELAEALAAGRLSPLGYTRGRAA